MLCWFLHVGKIQNWFLTRTIKTRAQHNVGKKYSKWFFINFINKSVPSKMNNKHKKGGIRMHTLIKDDA